MSESRVVNYVKNLAPKQKERFRTFVFSPYFNQHEKTKDLLVAILKLVNGKKAKEEIDREALFKMVFPKEKIFDEQRLFNVMSYLKKLYQKFIAYEYLEKNETIEQLYTLEAANDRSQIDLLKNRAHFLKKKLQKKKIRDVDYYYTNYKLNLLWAGFDSNDEIMDKSKEGMMQAMLDNFDKYYIAEKLRMCCQLNSDMQAMNVNFNFSFLEELLKYLRENWSIVENNLIIKLYYTILMSQNEKDAFYYNQLKEIIDTSQFNGLNEDQQVDLYKSAYNYCILKINNGDNDYSKELMELYKQGLERRLLFQNGELSDWIYKNITTLGCVLNQFDWTEKFINEYKQYLPPEKMANAYSYNKANLYFNKAQYDEVQSLLVNVQFTDFKYHINATILLMRTYYKILNTEALLSLIETFRIFLIRNKDMPSSQKRGYTNYIRFKKRLINLKHNEDTFSTKDYQSKLENLKKDIERTEDVYAKHWLLSESQP